MRNICKITTNEDAAQEEAGQGEEKKPPAEGEAVTESAVSGAKPGAEGEAAVSPAEETTEGQKTEQMPSEESQALAEQQPPQEGETPVESEPPKEGQPPAEGQVQEEKPPAEPTGFEKFKMIVAEKDYDIIALPEAVIAPTENKDEVSIPHYSLVEKRRNSGEGVLLYIKDSLRYKVVDLVTDNPDEHPSIDQLVAKLELNGLKSPEAEKIFEEIAAAEVSAGTTDAAPATEGAAPTTEEAAPIVEGDAPSSEDVAKKTDTATEEVKTSEPSGETEAQETHAPEASAAPEAAPVEPVADVTPVPSSPMVEAAA